MPVIDEESLAPAFRSGLKIGAKKRGFSPKYENAENKTFKYHKYPKNNNLKFPRSPVTLKVNNLIRGQFFVFEERRKSN